ncbi:hypothetical protein [Roseomonas sp. USHLN139]|uniref:hypothetical protein n=1 Tax=Roseomonas sp. USHLN139 TaxID=3081298 RepID=UPI003B02306C
MPSETTAPPMSRAAALLPAIGLGQGIALHLLLLDAPRGLPGWLTAPGPYALGLTGMLLLPVSLMLALGRWPGRLLWSWLAAATALLAAMAWHDAGWWGPGGPEAPSARLLGSAMAMVFLGHHLLGAAARGGRWPPPYADCFEQAWQDSLRLALAFAFLGAFWLVLEAGAALFSLIGLEGLERLVNRRSFALPASGLILGLGLALLGLRERLSLALRSLLLTLLAWLMPLLALLAAGFLLALPLTGLERLWHTQLAAGGLLGAAALLILLINAVHQDGLVMATAPRLQATAARLGALVLPVLALLALWALALRVGQYGLTPDRVLGLAAGGVAALYAAGYLAAAARPGMAPLGAVNQVMAWASLALLVLLNSPLAAPERLSFNDQLARLADGRTAPGRFDRGLFQRELGPAGRAALLHPPLRDMVEAGPPALGLPEPQLRFVPPATRLPDSFAEQQQETLRSGCWRGCDVMVLDLDGDGRPEVLLGSTLRLRVWREAAEGWSELGSYNRCAQEAAEASREGRYSLEPSPWRDLVVEGRRFRLELRQPCGF